MDDRLIFRVRNKNLKIVYIAIDSPVSHNMSHACKNTPYDWFNLLIFLLFFLVKNT